MQVSIPYPYNELVTAVLIIIVSFVIAKLSYKLFKKYLEEIAKKTKTTLDDKIIKMLERPIYLLIIFTGIFFALKNLTMLQAHYSLIDVFFSIILILLAARIAADIVQMLFQWYLESIAPKTKAQLDKQFMPIIKNVLTLAVYGIALIMILGKLGYEVGPLIAGLGIAGLAIALALQSTLANFFAGFYTLADKPLRVGDFVKLENGEEGEVQSIGWRSTRIITPSNYLVVIPNSKLAESILINYSLPTPPLSLVEKIGVAYGSSISKVEKALKEAADKTMHEMSEQVVKEFTPIIRFNGFSESSLDYLVILRVQKRGNLFSVGPILRKEINNAFKKYKITIPFPTRTVYLKKV